MPVRYGLIPAAVAVWMIRVCGQAGNGFMRHDIRPADWQSFEAVMGERGGCGGCWCMLWRCSASQWEAGRGQGNREAMKEIFDAGHVPGLVALHEGRAIGWIQLDERAAFPRLERSRILRRVDDARVWSVSCFLVDRQFRRQGLSLALLRAACDWARERGAGILGGVSGRHAAEAISGGLRIHRIRADLSCRRIRGGGPTIRDTANHAACAGKRLRVRKSGADDRHPPKVRTCHPEGPRCRPPQSYRRRHGARAGHGPCRAFL